MKTKSILLAACLTTLTTAANAQYAVMPKLPVPVATQATGVSEYGFTANWQTVDPEQLDDYGYEPVGYYLRTYVTMTATQDKQVFYHINTDFSQLTGSGTLDAPENYITEDNPFTLGYLDCKTRTGWQVQNQSYVNGVLCLNGAYNKMISNGTLVSPITDFTKGGGVVHVKFKLRGDGKTTKIGVYLRDDSTFPNTNLDVKQLDVTTDWVEHELTLEGGVAEGDLMIMGEDAGTGENIYYFIDDLQVWQELAVGEMAQALFAKQFVMDDIEATSDYVETYSLNPGEDYGFTVSSYSYNGISYESNLVLCGIDNPYTTAISQPEIAVDDASAPIYDLSGRRILTPQPNGIYVKQGKKFVAK